MIVLIFTKLMIRLRIGQNTGTQFIDYFDGLPIRLPKTFSGLSNERKHLKRNSPM